MSNNSNGWVNAQLFLISGFSSQIAALSTNPIDVVKTRLQVQGELGKTQITKYNGFGGGLMTIIKNESIGGLYKGIGASLLREGIYSTIRLGGYDVIKRFLGATDPNNTPFWKKLCSGAISGMLGACLATPTDLIKVRMQASEGTVYKTCFHGFAQVYKNEGLAGLYRGTVPTTQRAALLTAVQVSTYDQCKFLLRTYLHVPEGLFNNFLAAVTSGLVSAIVTSPVDLVKTRLMNQSISGQPALYKNVWDCITKTIRKEGFFGIYKGFFPTWIRIGPHTIICFVINEKLRRMVGLRPV